MLNLHTEYSCAGDYVKQMGSAACFRYVFNHLDRNTKTSIDYVIKIYSGLDAVNKERWNNGCFLNKREIRNHLDLLKGIIPFRAKIVSKEENGLKFFEIRLRVENIKGIYHKFLLTWIRYLYEFPYNMYIVEANKLRKEKPFMFDSISNLFNLVGSSVSLGGGHSIAWGNAVGFLQRKELTAKIGQVRALNNIYKRYNDGGSVDTRVTHKGRDLSYYDLEYWRDEELFQRRLAVYQEKYKKIKNRK